MTPLQAGGDTESGEMRQPTGDGATCAEKPSRGAASLLERIGHGGFDVLRVEQCCVGGGVHRAPKACEQLSERPFVAERHAPHQRAVGGPVRALASAI